MATYEIRQNNGQETVAQPNIHIALAIYVKRKFGQLWPRGDKGWGQ